VAKCYKKTRSKITLGYWKIRGLAAPARMMLSYAKAEGKLMEFEDVTYELTAKPDGGWDGSCWGGVDKPPLKKKNALINLPYIIDHDEGGLIITQSTACYQHLARSLGLMGNGSAAQTSGVEQILAQAFDLRNDTMKVVYPFGGVTPDKYPAELKKHLEGVAVHYGKFEDWLATLTSGSWTFVGSGVTAADFHVWEMVDQHEKMAKAAGLPSPLAPHAKLAAFYSAFRAVPQLQEYFASEAYSFICNNKMANFM